MKFTERGDRNEIFLKSSIISLAVYENDPKKFLEENDEIRNIDHQIKEICCSQIEDKTNKKLYIGFRGNQNVKDLIEDSKIYSKISDINGRFHSGFYNHAQKVPKEYFIEKLQQGYELILTGHSLGAAVAANIVVYFLYRLDFTAQYAEKVIFIGFGCPSIADVYFKENVDQKFKKNFVFIKNENDIVVEIFEYISYLIHKNDQTNSSNLYKLINFINDILSYKTNISNVIEKCNQMKLLVGPMTQIVIPKYTHFGILYKLNRDKGLEEVIDFEFDKDYFSMIFTKPDKLINKIQDHFMRNYFRNLKDNQYFDDRIGIHQRNRILSINLNTDLNFEIKEENIINLKLIQMRDYTDLVLFIDKSIINIEYLVAIKLILCEKDNILSNNETVYFKDDVKVLDNDSIYFKFNFLNQKICDKNNNLKFRDFFFEFYSHFNSKPIEVIINSESNKFIKFMKPGSYQKHKLIDNMRFDLMYLQAAFYCHALERMDDLNQNFIDLKNDLLEIFESLDIILKEIWEEILEDERVYTENDLNEMKILVKNYFDVFGIKRVEFKDLSDKLKNKIFDPSFYQTLGYGASKVLGLIVGVAVGGTIVVAGTGIGGVLGLLVATGTGAPVAVEAGAEIQNKISNIIDKKRFPSNLDYDKVYEIIIKQSKQIKNDDYENQNLYFYEKSYDKEFVNHWSEEKDKFIFKLILLNKKLREILKKYYIFGSIGTKNAGKSKFVELITNQNTDSDTMNTTTKSKAYSMINENNELIYKEAVIIDYPHANSNSLDEKLEFYFTRFLLDHVYLIFEAEDNGADSNQTELINLVKTNNFSGFTILFNKSDRLFTSKNPNRITFENFKSVLTDNLIRNCKYLNLNVILFTCMDVEDGRLYEREITEMKDKGVILSDGLKRIVFAKIDSIKLI
ncbi:unnamed protein product [Brachionus calyciflorus]|uniref:Fungal lipase-type domain-containing protein n=1 Tax=Brachionus calyciflorus TaxID=104777 RepID=A0A813NSS2_9BILA|nr:unnamed protein product [Brachionus calyciflorus]